MDNSLPEGFRKLLATAAGVISPTTVSLACAYLPATSLSVGIQTSLVKLAVPLGIVGLGCVLLLLGRPLAYRLAYYQSMERASVSRIGLVRIVILNGLVLFYPSWVYEVMSMFSCVKLDDVNKISQDGSLDIGASMAEPQFLAARHPQGYWAKDMGLECYTGQH